jgi:hypothetical protein
MTSICLPSNLCDIEFRRAGTTDAVLKWCEEHIGNRVEVKAEWITRRYAQVWMHFERDTDFVAFKLAWL